MDAVKQEIIRRNNNISNNVVLAGERRNETCFIISMFCNYDIALRKHIWRQRNSAFNMNLHKAPEIVFFLVGKECQARIGRA